VDGVVQEEIDVVVKHTQFGADREGRIRSVIRAVDGSDERAVLVGLVFELRTKPVDVDVECIFLDGGFVAPPSFDKLFARGDQAAATLRASSRANW
jgi:hypothetical protein